MSSKLRALARNQLGNKIFHNNWLTALLAALITGAIVCGVQTATAFAGPVATVLVIGPMEYGMETVFLKQARNHAPMQMSDLFNGFRDDFGGTLLIGLLTKLFVVLWSMLFVIPGIVKSYSYSMARYIKYDHPEFSATQCIDASRSLMQGHKWQLFCLDLSFIGWAIVGMLCFGLGTLWVVAYQQAARAQFYEALILVSGED